MTNLAREIHRLRAAPLDELVRRYSELYGGPPRHKHKTWLWRRIAWQLQANAHGGLSQTTQGRLEALAAAPTPLLGRAAREKVTPRAGGSQASRDGLPIGTELVRVWRGQEVRVRAVQGGYEHAGVTYRSLTAVAQAITGSHWNGRLFWGLSDRQRGSKTP